MKKLIAILAVMAMMISGALAESIDLDALSMSELERLRDRVNAEIAARCMIVNGQVIFENDVARICFLSWNVSSLFMTSYLNINLEWTNLSDRDASVLRYLDCYVYVDGVRTGPSGMDGFVDMVRPGVTHSITIRILIPENAREAEVKLTDRSYSPVTYETLVIDLR